MNFKKDKNVIVLKEGSQGVHCTYVPLSFLLGTKMIKKIKKTNVYLQHKSTVCNLELLRVNQMHAQCYAKKKNKLIDKRAQSSNSSMK